MHINKIHIQNYRNYNDFTMEFHKGLNVIIGSNNSGKTGLLYAINLLKYPSDISINDFNKNNLRKHFELYTQNAPSIVIEYYITNPLQTMLIKLIGMKSTIINIVGDVAQSIYSFQGAKPSDFNRFIINEDNDTQYSIEGNRRSTENIVNLCNFLGEDNFIISVFDEQDRDNLKDNVSKLLWDTSYTLFNEVFSDNSKYMTVHQAKGLEWDKVVVAAIPASRDKIKLSDMFVTPKLTDENSADEFVRLYYVACSRAREDLYIHIPSGCTREIIEMGLTSYIQRENCKLEYEFL